MLDSATLLWRSALCVVFSFIIGVSTIIYYGIYYIVFAFTDAHFMELACVWYTRRQFEI